MGAPFFQSIGRDLFREMLAATDRERPVPSRFARAREPPGAATHNLNGKAPRSRASSSKLGLPHYVLKDDDSPASANAK